MKRTIEKLHQERREKEEDYRQRLEKLREKPEPSPLPAQRALTERLDRLESLVRNQETLTHKLKDALQPLSRKTSGPAGQEKGLNREVISALRDLEKLVDQALRRQAELLSSLPGLLTLAGELTDAKDKEWDALGSNHVGLIFKSMEWRVDRLAAEYEDVKILMTKFLLIEDKLNRLLAVLDEKKMPTRAEVSAVLEPIQDWRYTGFENRFRGDAETVRAQLEPYAGLFKKGSRVLDLGCGRGEFLEMLRGHGVEAEGLDLNGQMVEACLDKGLKCRRGELLQELAGYPDASLDGIFSSQVIEHLPSAAIKRLVELAFSKLRPSGLLVLETINPLSLFTLAHVFFLDLSHLTPVHPQAARFLLEAAGFRNVDVRFAPPLEREKLQSLPGADELSSVLNRNIDALNELLFAPPSFAVMGHRP